MFLAGTLRRFRPDWFVVSLMATVTAALIGFHGLGTHNWFATLLMTGWVKDATGYLAGALVLSTFSVRSMRLLRCFAIASNVAFISYAVIAGMAPILVLHGLLLPMNLVRLIQIEGERRALLAASR